MPQRLNWGFRMEVARPERFELPTLWFEARAREISNALSSVAYGCKNSNNCPSVGLFVATNPARWHVHGFSSALLEALSLLSPFFSS